MDLNIKKTPRVFYEKITTFLLAGFGFVAGLAWNDAVQSLFAFLWPDKSNSIPAKFMYALFVTLVLTFISLRLAKSENRK